MGFEVAHLGFIWFPSKPAESPDGMHPKLNTDFCPFVITPHVFWVNLTSLKEEINLNKGPHAPLQKTLGGGSVYEIKKNSDH